MVSITEREGQAKRKQEKEMLEKKCSVCPQTFKTKSERRKTCSHECSVQHHDNCKKLYEKSEKGRDVRKRYAQHRRKK